MNDYKAGAGLCIFNDAELNQFNEFNIKSVRLSSEISLLRDKLNVLNITGTSDNVFANRRKYEVINLRLYNIHGIMMVIHDKRYRIINKSEKWVLDWTDRL